MAGFLGAGAGLLGGISDRRAGKGSNKERKKMMAGALGELSPEAITNLMHMFFSKYYSMMAPQLMGAQQGLAAKMGRMGGTGSGVAQQLSAGLPGQFAQGALGQSFASALPVAQSRANVYRENTPNYTPLGNWAGIGSQALQGFMGQYGGPRYT